MLWAALLLAQPAPLAEPVRKDPHQFVVFGQRLERLRFSATVRGGRVRCRIVRSSGDPAFDAIACPAVSDCAARQLRSQSQIEACMGERLRARYDALQRQEPPQR